MWLANRFVADVKYANRYIYIFTLIYIRHTKKHVYITCAYREKLGKAATLSRF